jgi:hypothetical protein
MLVAPRLSRTTRLLISEKSANRRSINSIGVMSKKLTCCGAACGTNSGFTGRGVKKCGWPNSNASALLAMLCNVCHAVRGSCVGRSGQEIASQSAARRSIRCSGRLPAMIAASIAPIEMLATQSGCRSCSAIAW